MNFVNPEEVYEIAGCYVEVTSQCNLRCVHCYNDSGVDKGKISVEAYKELINQFDIDSKLVLCQDLVQVKMRFSSS